MLSDLGAEIWKVEPPGGDPGRGVDSSPGEFNRYFEAHDRGKRSIVLDLRSDAGREVALRMAERVDAVIENYRPAVMDRLGLGYETLKALNPGIVMVSASAFGSLGPQAGEPGYDVIGQAMGRRNDPARRGRGGRAGHPARRLRRPGRRDAGLRRAARRAADPRAQRRRRPAGRCLAARLADRAAVRLSDRLHAHRRAAIPAPPPDAHVHFLPRERRPLVRAGSDSTRENWHALCGLLEQPEWEADERFRDAPARLRNSDALEALLEATFELDDRAGWLRRLREVDIPCAPVNDYEAVAASEQVRVNGYITEVADEAGELQPVVGLPWRFSSTPGAVQGHAPLLNADADAIMAECGYDTAQIEDLRSRGANPV